MIITVIDEGGGAVGFIPGLQQADATVDLDNPSPGAQADVLEKLRAKVQETDLFSLPIPPGPAHAPTTRVHIQDLKRTRTLDVHAGALGTPAVLKEIIDLVRQASQVSSS